MRIYLDNAATTPVDEQVFEAMKPYLTNVFGNPSSIHTHGREVKAAIEKSRKTIADLLNATPSEIFFTSGGTEADNTAIRCSVETLGIKHCITSRIEHHAVMHTMERLQQLGKIKLSYVNLSEDGHIDYDHLEALLKKENKSLVSLMHANNEIANLTDINKIGELCQEYGAVFHSDTVQSMGHYVHDMQQLKIHCMVGSAHKFHGPKGIGFLYVNHDHKIDPFIHGGAQERNMRGGTENVSGIIGLAKALEMAYENMEAHHNYIQSLKTRMITSLQEVIPDVGFNGDCANPDKSLYTVLNVCLPESDDNEMLLFNLDINKISASGGSACSSGSNVGSHVLSALKTDPKRGAIRFSFSKFNTAEEIDYTVEKLAEFYKVKV
ncbi:cysteine desulfurase family protein [Fulvivirgaceae bacterium BMA12]|uniref:cysteine desulfurase n=1 Tax=Agaribacillus aureus TaxID=3051825 RepID=A0ABT8LI20_9BACT|nr:cysteine desulfurase family protein [Fulvivirgaceae bacterium BMA12]